MNKFEALPPLPAPSDALVIYTQSLPDYEDFTGLTVLDVNCGDGRDSLFLSKLGYSSVLGIDGDHAAISLANANRSAQHMSRERVRFVQRSVTDISAEGQHQKRGFDLAIAVKGLHQHTKSRQKVMLSGMRELTRSGGVNIVSGFIISKHIEDDSKKAQMLYSRELQQYYTDQQGWDHKYFEFPKSVRMADGTPEGKIAEMTLSAVIARKRS